MHGGLVGLLVWEGPATPGQTLLSCVRKQTSEQSSSVACAPFPASRFLPRASSIKDCDLQDGISPFLPQIPFSRGLFHSNSNTDEVKTNTDEILLALFTLKVYRIFALAIPGNFSELPFLSPVLKLEAICQNCTPSALESC